MTKWVKVARLLQARAHLRIAYATGEDKGPRATKALTALTGALASNADDADFTYPAASVHEIRTIRSRTCAQFLFASDYLIQMLKGRSDPRLPILFTPIQYDSIKGTGTSRVTFPAKPNTYVGHLSGGDQTQADSTVSLIGPFFSNETAPLNVVSFADQKFTEAEARLIVSGAGPPRTSRIATDSCQHDELAWRQQRSTLCPRPAGVDVGWPIPSRDHHREGHCQFPQDRAVE